MTATTVELKWHNNDHVKHVPATRAGQHFAVHNQGLLDGAHPAPAWQIIHQATSLVIPGRFYTAEAATQAAVAVEAVADWTGGDIDQVRRVASAVAGPVAAALAGVREADRAAYFTAAAPDWPASEDAVTADGLARYYTVQAAKWGAKTQALAGGFFGSDKPHAERDQAYLHVSVGYLNAWTTALTLRSLIGHAPEEAERVARVLWCALEDGGSPGEYTYGWLVGYRLDPDKMVEDVK